MTLNIIFYVISFVFIWIGAGLVINSIDRIAKKLKLSTFSVSFFVLGILTSIPEIAIGTTAVVQKKPDIFAGSLLGGSIIILLFIVPFLAILGNGIRISNNLSRSNLFFSLFVIALPGLFAVDRSVSTVEGLILIGAYACLFFSIERKHGVLDKKNTNVLSTAAYSFLDIAKVAFGIAIVFMASQFIVNQTVLFSSTFGISMFYISLVVLSIGANLPELSVAVRAIVSGKKEIAFGNYIGSAATNSLLWGIFSIACTEKNLIGNNFLVVFIYLVVGLILFYYFSKSSRDISRKEGIVLMIFYALFLLTQLVQGISD